MLWPRKVCARPRVILGPGRQMGPQSFSIAFHAATPARPSVAAGASNGVSFFFSHPQPAAVSASPERRMGEPDSLEDLYGPSSSGPVACVKESVASVTLTSLQCHMIYSATWCKASVRDRGRGNGRMLMIVGRSDNLHVAWIVASQVMAANGSVRFTQERESLLQQFAIASNVLAASGLATFYQIPLVEADPLSQWIPDPLEQSGVEPRQDSAELPCPSTAEREGWSGPSKVPPYLDVVPPMGLLRTVRWRFQACCFFLGNPFPLPT